jgi:hypothetical protein
MYPIFQVLFTFTLSAASTAFIYAHWLYTFLQAEWARSQTATLTDLGPHSRYFLGQSATNMDMHLTVPDDRIYVEEWVQSGIKKCVIRYAGESIPRAWTESPFTKHVRSPWVWVGDRETEIDLTRTFNRYLVVGNRITSELVEKLIRVTPKTNLIYIESGTFKELKFPGDGLTIQEYDERPIQNSGAVPPVEEAVCSPVVGGHSDSVE